ASKTGNWGAWSVAVGHAHSSPLLDAIPLDYFGDTRTCLFLIIIIYHWLWPVV
ncbi:hypothetical protein ACJX0J_033168, partial [Zea mays]